MNAPSSAGLPAHVLITGGAGFIGAHLADELLRAGCRVRVLDSLDPQVHPDGSRPAYLNSAVELVRGDVRSPDAVRQSLAGVDAVCHLAAAVGVGQSMYEIERYTSVNDLGTAVLLEGMMGAGVSRLLVASSMSIYGEGLVHGPAGAVDPPPRSAEQLEARRWELEGEDGAALEPLPTPETKTPALGSIYALGKYAQERMCLIFGRAYSVPTTALRFFNVYGANQALSNPYTGVLAIFGARLLNGAPPLIFEDGLQRRDFVHVRDVARACRLALQTPAAAGEVFNIGSGVSRTILEIAQMLARAAGCETISPQCTGRYRVGDIRHCFADIGRARSILGFEPQVDFGEGLEELAGWLSTQAAVDRVVHATAELTRRGLVV